MIARKLISQTLSSLSISDTDSIGVGVSGGADSSALLIALSKIYHGDRSKQVHVIVVNHQLQKATDQVSQDVATAAQSLGFSAHIVPVDIIDTRNGAEQDARTARYQAFEKVQENENLSLILLGHTKHDQAEQVLLGMLRGSGTRSLSGIPEVRGSYARPFLNGLTREETQNVCKENNFTYWNDPHNNLTKYRRVAVRKLLQNVEKETGQSIIEPLVRTAKISAEDANALDFFAATVYASAENTSWLIETFKNSPVAIRKRIYRKKLLSIGAPSESITYELLERVEELVGNWQGQGEIAFANGYQVSRKSNSLVFAKNNTEEKLL